MSPASPADWDGVDTDVVFEQIAPLQEHIAALQGQVETHLLERRAMFVCLHQRGERLSDIARAAGVTPMAIKFQLNKWEKAQAEGADPRSMKTGGAG